MSDYHLQQLAAASASVPGDILGAPEPQPAGPPPAPSDHVAPVAAPVAPPVYPPVPQGQVHYTVPQPMMQLVAPMIPAPHPYHAPHAVHAALHAPHAALLAHDPPPEQQQQQAPPLHVTDPSLVQINMHVPPSHAQVPPLTSLPPAPHVTALAQLAGVPLELDLEGKYQAKCAECNGLRHELAMKNTEIRKLKQEICKKNKMASPKVGAEAALSTLQGENITIDVDIGPSSSRTRSYDQRWKSRFQDLVKYKLTHGDCIVPKSYKDKGLHSWVRKQRILKKDFDLGLASDESMTQERVNALNSVGFAWVVGHQSNDVGWESNFQQLVVFKSQYGHTRVPQSYDKTLHKWVLNQRCRRRLLEDKGEGKAKGMTWTRIEKLDAIDFAWSGKK